MEFVGPINSAFIHYSQKTGQQMRLKEKKKKEKTQTQHVLSAIQTYT